MEETKQNVVYSRAMKDLSIDDMPREKALKHGFEVLSVPELMAILIGSGSRGENVVDLCKRILRDCDERLSTLARLSVPDLVNNYRGVGEAKALIVLAALELSRRYHSENFEEMPQVVSSQAAFNCVPQHLRDIAHEEFWILTLNRAKRVSGKYRISQGGTAATVVDVKMVMKKAIEHLADGIIAVHNHPSGSLRPSAQDDDLTHRIRESCKLLGIEMVDHIIVAGKDYYSYVDNGR